MIQWKKKRKIIFWLHEKGLIFMSAVVNLSLLKQANCNCNLSKKEAIHTLSTSPYIQTPLSTSEITIKSRLLFLNHSSYGRVILLRSPIRRFADNFSPEWKLVNGKPIGANLKIIVPQFVLRLVEADICRAPLRLLARRERKMPLNYSLRYYTSLAFSYRHTRVHARERKRETDCNNVIVTRAECNDLRARPRLNKSPWIILFAISHCTHGHSSSLSIRESKEIKRAKLMRNDIHESARRSISLGEFDRWSGMKKLRAPGQELEICIAEGRAPTTRTIDGWSTALLHPSTRARDKHRLRESLIRSSPRDARAPRYRRFSKPLPPYVCCCWCKNSRFLRASKAKWRVVVDTGWNKRSFAIRLYG